jgi:hypothetical protein
VVWHERLGLSADEIATEYGLSLADVYAALTHSYNHRGEIDRSRALFCYRHEDAKRPWRACCERHE